MSQTLTTDIAMGLKRGDILFHNILAFGLVEGEKDPATCTVLGKAKRIPGVEEFSLPVQRNYGDKAKTTISRMSRDLWRTTPEKIEPLRVRRERAVHTPSVPEPESSVDDKTPVTRVRRTRTTATGRVVDDGANLLQTAQEQLMALRRTVERTGQAVGTATQRFPATEPQESNAPKSGSRVRGWR